MPDMHLPTFFAFIRRSPFGGRLSQSQVDGINNLLSVWGQDGDGDVRKLAYILATNFHETGGRMQPVREGFAKTDRAARRIVKNRKYGKPAGPWGHVYYGRGDVQLTWWDNYVRMGAILNIPLEKDPDLALDPVISKKILVEGMMRGKSYRGDFTGKALEDYFNDTVNDPVGARRIVNGTDKASLIATYYRAFLDSIVAATEAETGERMPDPPEAGAPDGLRVATDETSLGGILALLASGSGALITGISNPYALAAFGLALAGAFLVLSGRIRLSYEKGA